MRDPLRDSAREAGGSVETASRRLDRALAQLEERFERRLKQMDQATPPSGEGGEAIQLFAELQASRARERALEAIAAEASAALGRAADEVRAALAEPGVESSPTDEPALSPMEDPGVEGEPDNLYPASAAARG